MILSAQSIAERCQKGEMKLSQVLLNGELTIEPCWTEGMINPFFKEKLKRHGRSYGLSAASYDVRLAHGLWLIPGWGRLGHILEHIRMPDDLAGQVKDKSTNARLFILVQNTWIDPGWEGYLTVEITRLKPWPVYLKAGTPIAQIVFNRLDEPTAKPYGGKYQRQPFRPVHPILETTE